MRVLVTGAAGMLGRDLIPVLEAAGDEVTGVDLDVDITDPQAVARCIDAVRPEVVYHCAAWTDVDGAEAHEEEARAVNVDGSRNVAAAAAQVGAAVVAISTDYVFAGDRRDGYAETDETAPCGAYGRTKRDGEVAAISVHPEGVRIVRTAWLYGRNGRNFVDTMRALGADRDEVSVVADQTGSPTWTCDLAPALLQIARSDPGIYHAAGEGAVSWADFAEAIFDEAGIDCIVNRVTTAEFGRPAPRPEWSILSVTRPDAPRLRPWQEALTEYIASTPAETDDEGRKDS